MLQKRYSVASLASSNDQTVSIYIYGVCFVACFNAVHFKMKCSLVQATARTHTGQTANNQRMSSFMAAHQPNCCSQWTTNAIAAATRLLFLLLIRFNVSLGALLLTNFHFGGTSHGWFYLDICFDFFLHPYDTCSFFFVQPEAVYVCVGVFVQQLCSRLSISIAMYSFLWIQFPAVGAFYSFDASFFSSHS